MMLHGLPLPDRRLVEKAGNNLEVHQSGSTILIATSIPATLDASDHDGTYWDTRRSQIDILNLRLCTVVQQTRYFNSGH